MATDTDKINKAGDVIINNVTIVTSKGFDQFIKPQVVGIEIYEDIFAPFITGKLFVRDSQELSNVLPLVGEEVVKIDFRTPSLPEEEGFVREFFIYRMDNRQTSSEREVIFALHFTSKEAIIDLNKKISKAYGGRVSDLAKAICMGGVELECETTKKDVYIEETKNSTKFISNWWRPTQCLQYLCETAVNANNSPSYVFFENKAGLNFISLDTLYTGSPIKQMFMVDNYSRAISPGTGSAERSIEMDYQRILQLDTPQSYDYMERLQSGMYGSEVISYDLLTKQYSHVGYSANFTDANHLNPYPLWTDNPPARARSTVYYSSKYYNNFDNFDDVTNTSVMQKRQSILAQANAYKINITVFGRTDYSVGQRVYVQVPQRTQISDTATEQQKYDQVMSGVYLVSAIGHLVTVEGHQCSMELIKDSLLVDINDTSRG